MDTHVFFFGPKLSDWSAYGAILSLGRREALKEPAIPDLTQPTIFVTQDTFFALGMGCPSPDIAMKYPVSRHPPRRMRPPATVCWRTLCHRTWWMSCVPCIWRKRRIGRTFSFRATTKVVGTGKPMGDGDWCLGLLAEGLEAAVLLSFIFFQHQCVIHFKSEG